MGEGVVRAVHLDDSRARSGRFDELVGVRREPSYGPAAANPNGARTGVVASSGGLSGQAFEIDASQQIEGRFVEQIKSSATLENVISPQGLILGTWYGRPVHQPCLHALTAK
jgi:hypothetical protein